MADSPVFDFQILEAMTRYGGSFAKAIAEAARRADPPNYATLRAAFPGLWAEYAKVAQLIAKGESALRVTR